jgi:hypothetical protein
MINTEIVFNVEDNIWIAEWEEKILEVTPMGNDYIIKIDEDIIHHGADIITLLDIIADITGKTPLFKTENVESALYH